MVDPESCTPPPAPCGPCFELSSSPCSHWLWLWLAARPAACARVPAARTCAQDGAQEVRVRGGVEHEASARHLQQRHAGGRLGRVPHRLHHLLAPQQQPAAMQAPTPTCAERVDAHMRGGGRDDMHEAAAAAEPRRRRPAASLQALHARTWAHEPAAVPGSHAHRRAPRSFCC